jgi:cellulose synthase/poly-beta-1,6-N-acetylglucosamine synthase-like glycosyltransferase
MEQHEAEAQEKAEKIVSDNRGKFRHLGYTIHSLAAGEAKGKASNISSCMEKFERIMPVNISLEKVYVTVVDCDSLAPKEYIDEVNARIYKNPEKSLKTTFCPVQIFTRNNMEVPLLVRAFDNFHSLAHWHSGFIPGAGFALPLSNFTISYVALKSNGFLDTYPEAIAEDSHTTLKLFWKRNTDYYGEMIYTPFNQLNL